MEVRLEYYNPNPLIKLIGRVNQFAVKIDGGKVWALIDMGAQVSISHNHILNKGE